MKFRTSLFQLYDTSQVIQHGQLSHHKNPTSLSILATFHETLIVFKSVVMSAWKRGEGGREGRERREGRREREGGMEEGEERGGGNRFEEDSDACRLTCTVACTHVHAYSIETSEVSERGRKSGNQEIHVEKSLLPPPASVDKLRANNLSMPTVR